ncbi:UNVERIFIED_CONTAM: hypothetical protein HDU68_006368 [Siphonaria sp. JEL0065]|nr:hypothetical protein HDU68_006368 [Siphonaria sp. JEL0065]
MRISALILASIASTVSAAFDTCTSSTGGSIQIIAPAQGQLLNVGDNFDATNPNNVTPLQGGTLATKTPATVASGQAFVTVPNVPAGKAYALEAQYLDVDAARKWMQCFSPTFAIANGATPPPPVTTAVVTKGNAGHSVSFGVVVGVLASLLL